MSENTTNEPIQPLLLSLVETCSMLGVGRSTLYERIGAGDIEVVRIGRRTLVPLSVVQQYVANLRGANSTQPPAA